MMVVVARVSSVEASVRGQGGMGGGIEGTGGVAESSPPFLFPLTPFLPYRRAGKWHTSLAEKEQ